MPWSVTNVVVCRLYWADMTARLYAMKYLHHFHHKNVNKQRLLIFPEEMKVKCVCGVLQHFDTSVLGNLVGEQKEYIADISTRTFINSTNFLLTL